MDDVNVGNKWFREQVKQKILSRKLAQTLQPHFYSAVFGFHVFDGPLTRSGACMENAKEVKERANEGLKQTEKKNNLRSNYPPERKVLRAWMLWWIFLRWRQIAVHHAMSESVHSCSLIGGPDFICWELEGIKQTPSQSTTTKPLKSTRVYFSSANWWGPSFSW